MLRVIYAICVLQLSYTGDTNEDVDNGKGDTVTSYSLNHIIESIIEPANAVLNKLILYRD